jgi:hypothetical protein
LCNSHLYASLTLEFEAGAYLSSAHYGVLVTVCMYAWDSFLP